VDGFEAVYVCFCVKKKEPNEKRRQLLSVVEMV